MRLPAYSLVKTHTRAGIRPEVAQREVWSKSAAMSGGHRPLGEAYRGEVGLGRCRDRFPRLPGPGCRRSGAGAMRSVVPAPSPGADGMRRSYASLLAARSESKG